MARRAAGTLLSPEVHDTTICMDDISFVSRLDGRSPTRYVRFGVTATTTPGLHPWFPTVPVMVECSPPQLVGTHPIMAAGSRSPRPRTIWKLLVFVGTSLTATSLGCSASSEAGGRAEGDRVDPSPDSSPKPPSGQLPSPRAEATTPRSNGTPGPTESDVRETGPGGSRPDGAPSAFVPSPDGTEQQSSPGSPDMAAPSGEASMTNDTPFIVDEMGPPSAEAYCECPADVTPAIVLHIEPTSASSNVTVVERDAGTTDSTPGTDAGIQSIHTLRFPHPESPWAKKCGLERLHTRARIGCGTNMSVHACAEPDGGFPCLELDGSVVRYWDEEGTPFSGSMLRSAYSIVPRDEEPVIDGTFDVSVSSADSVLHVAGELTVCGTAGFVFIAC